MQIFSLAGIPVRASLGFLLIVAYYGYSLSGAGVAVAVGLILGFTLSILIHEFGHALVARRYKLAPQIELHFWGGLCQHQPARTNRHDVQIIVAGPLLQILVGAAVWGFTRVVPPTGMFSYFFVESFLYVSLIWGALNLFAPIWPLDGGQLFRMIMLRLVKPAAKAEKIVHVVGIALAVVVALLGFIVFKTPLLGILGIMWALENIRAYSSGNPVPVRVRSEHADRLLAESAQAIAQDEWHEARRLAFQARDEKTITEDQLARIFEIIVVASAELKDWHEALAWSPRAPRTPAAFAAKVKALSGLGKRDQALAELDAADAPRLPPEVATALRAMIEAPAGAR